MRLGVITDTHANLPALRAALAAMATEGCDHIVHTGDAIGIGPHPSEVMTVLGNHPRVSLIMGNHDALFAYGLPQPLPAWMSAGEILHQQWTHEHLDESWREWVRGWPYQIDREFGPATVRFQHYGLRGDDFAAVVRDNDPADLDDAFQSSTDIVFFGHHHPRADVQGRARYINPGALGCHTSQGARYALLDLGDGGFPTVTMRSAPYDASQVYADMTRREVPEADFIMRTFLR